MCISLWEMSLNGRVVGVETCLSDFPLSRYIFSSSSRGLDLLEVSVSNPVLRARPPSAGWSGPCLVMNTSKDGDSVASLGNLCLITLPKRGCFFPCV